MDSRESPVADRIAIVGVSGLRGAGAELFDAAFFGLTPGEAEALDPRHRLLLECAWQALEDAGYDPQSYRGRIGVLCGDCGSGGTGEPGAMLVSSLLGLCGPDLTVQSSGPAAALAVHLAVQSLLRGDADMALAGAASVAGEGAGLVVLKRLEEAVADGDTLRAVIRGSAMGGGEAEADEVRAEGVSGLIQAILAAGARTGRTTVVCPGGRGGGLRIEVEPAPEPRRQPSRPWQALLLSARTGTALETATAALAEVLRHGPETGSGDIGDIGEIADIADIGDIAYTLQVGRRRFEHRRLLVARDVRDALAALDGSEAGRLETFAGGGGERPVSFLLPGFGDHYPDMALGLYRDQPAFRSVVDDCCERLRPELGWDLRDELFPGLAGASGGGEAPAGPPAKLDLRRLVRGEGSAAEKKPAGRLTRMTAVHAAVFVVEYALAQLLIGWGVRPRAMIGYSLGEYTAACLAGVLSLGDCLTLIARRARLIEELPAGAMLAVPLPAEEIEPLLDGGLGIAVVNGPHLHVVSGPADSVAALEARLAGRGLLCRRLSSNHAGHSPMMEPIAPRLRELLAGFELKPPRIPYVSNVTGTWIRAEEATDPDYWVRHLCGRVLFGDGLSRLLEIDSALLEVGPGQSLTAFAKQHPAGGGGRASQTFATLPSAYNAQPDRAFLLATLGRLWMAGVPVDWAATHTRRRRRVPLPTYPFERRRFEIRGESRPSHPERERVHVWPNGMRIVAQTRTEADHFYQDIFEKEIYRRHGVELRDGACVFDVGANIGSFLLYAHRACRGALIHSFEPAPPLFAKLRRNAELNGVEARLFNIGISDREGTAELTFYPRSSGMSSFHADKEQEKEVLRLMMEGEREAGLQGVGELMSFAEDLLEERFRSETFECRLRPLSSVIAECGVEWIDLLKIDVQKAELAVLDGIRDEHWPGIGQIVMEVHDLDGRLERIVRRLGERGFRVAVEQDELVRGSVLYNLFAVREGAEPAEGARERQRRAFLQALSRPEEAESARRSAAAGVARPVFGTGYAAPGSELERSLAEVWQQVLKVDQIGIDDNFFDLGGTSLLGLQVVREIRGRLGTELSPVALFAAPTVRSLARHLHP